MTQMTRAQVETLLEKTFRGCIVSYQNDKLKTYTGIVHSIAAQEKGGELYAIAIIDDLRHECPVDFFIHNTVRHGNISRTGPRSPGL